MSKIPRKPGRRTHNTRLIKQDYSYSVEEISTLLDVHPNAVRRWLKAGLERIDDMRPTLIHGTTLKAFLKRRQSARKRRCEANEFYCCRCRVPRLPWNNLVDIVQIAPKRLILKAICTECGAKLNRIGTPVKRPIYDVLFDIQTVPE